MGAVRVSCGAGRGWGRVSASPARRAGLAASGWWGGWGGWGARRRGGGTPGRLSGLRPVGAGGLSGERLVGVGVRGGGGAARRVGSAACARWGRVGPAAAAVPGEAWAWSAEGNAPLPRQSQEPRPSFQEGELPITPPGTLQEVMGCFRPSTPPKPPRPHTTSLAGNTQSPPPRERWDSCDWRGDSWTPPVTVAPRSPPHPIAQTLTHSTHPTNRKPPNSPGVPSPSCRVPPTGRKPLSRSGVPSPSCRVPPTGRKPLSRSGVPSPSCRVPPTGRKPLSRSGVPSPSCRVPPTGRKPLSRSGVPSPSCRVHPPGASR